MDKNIAIEFDGVGKQYRLGLVGTGSLQHDINRWWQTTILRKEDPYLKIGEVNDRTSKGNSDYVWALKDISFKVEQGDVVGIIGKNGAGKSTLLKLLSHITAPSVGDIHYRGRIASLLEVGTGFHPEMTARQNIYMNGSIMGMTRQEITSKLDEIVDFAGIERYLDTPVKRFSSGMTVRLGFAVAAFLEPEILVVDEVLAVGDAEFQKKAIGKMKDVSSSGGRTVLFVSHNMSAVRMLCKNGVILKNGQIDYVGSAEDCVNHYMDTNIPILTNHSIIETKKHRLYNNELLHEIDVCEARILNKVDSVSTDEPLELVVKVRRNNLSINETQIVVNIMDEQDVRLVNYVTLPLKFYEKKDYVDISLKLKYHGLPKGKYKIGFATGIKDYSLGSRNYDVVTDVLSFEVLYTKQHLKKEYYAWNKSWAKIVHEGECIEAKIL